MRHLKQKRLIKTAHEFIVIYKNENDELAWRLIKPDCISEEGTEKIISRLIDRFKLDELIKESSAFALFYVSDDEKSIAYNDSLLRVMLTEEEDIDEDLETAWKYFEHIANSEELSKREYIEITNASFGLFNIAN